MKNWIGAIVLSLVIVQTGYGQELTQEWLDGAIEELRVNVYSGDLSAAKRRLRAVLEEDPKNLEALWQLTYTNHLARPKNWNLLDRAQHLRQASSQLQEIVKLAHDQGNTAYAHFVKAWEGLAYNAFPQALEEINQALRLEPDSIRYLMLKGRILVAQGDWENRDEAIEEGIKLIQQSWNNSKNHPSPFFKEENYHFRLAHSIWHFSRPRWEKVIFHYEQAIQHAEPNTTTQLYSWTNLSKAYRLQGQCEKAKQAAERSRAIEETKTATRQKQYAEFCLEMKTLGMALPINQAPSPADQ